MHAVYQLLNYYPVMQNACNSKLSTFKTSRCKGDCWWECLVGGLVLFLFVVVVLFGFFSEIKEKGPLNYLIKFLMANSVPILTGQKRSCLPPFPLCYCP